MKKYYKDEGRHCYCDSSHGINKCDYEREREWRETINGEFYGFLSFNIVVLKTQLRCTII